MGRRTDIQSSRIAGIDLARVLAVAGMLAVHVGPTALTDPAGRVYAELTHGRASILFALLAGIGVSLLAGSRSASLSETRTRLLWQAALLLPLGLWLQSLDVTILVVLSHYALLFALGAISVGLRTRLLAVLAATTVALGPVLFQLGRHLAPATFNRAPAEWGDPALEIAHVLALSGPYPLITWAGPFLVGMLLGRQDLRAPRLRLSLILGGLALALVSAGASYLLEQALGEPEGPRDWLRLVEDNPHSQMPPWLLGSIGSALLVLGLALVAADALGRLVWPLVATGQLALSVYVSHILAFHWFGPALRSPDVGGALVTLGGALAIAVLVSSLWRSLLPRGPLEAVLALPAILARWRRRRARQAERQVRIL